jgi:hypothetical protein
MGEMAQPFAAADDYGVQSGTATVALDLSAVDRRHGLAVDPDPREPLVLDLPCPSAATAPEFQEKLVENLSEHPLRQPSRDAHPHVRDAAGQEASTEPATMTLPGRRFFQPVARALIEQRRCTSSGRG